MLIDLSGTSAACKRLLLRTLPFLGLALMLAWISCLVWVVYLRHDNATVVARIEQAGGHVTFQREPNLLGRILRRNKSVSVSIYDKADTDRALQQVAELSAVDNLWIMNTTVQRDGLIHFDGLRLKQLSFQHVPITDDDLRYIAQLDSLDVLLLVDTRVTKQGARNLKEALPNVQVLFADENGAAAAAAANNK